MKQKKQTPKRLWILSGLALIALAGGLIYYFLYHPKAEPLTLYGNVDIRQVNMAFRVDGRLARMNYEEGDVIHQNDLLASLDDEPILNRLNQAKAQLEQAKAQLHNAILINQRKQTLCKTNDASKQECDDAQMNLEMSQANVHYAQSVVDEAQTAYDDVNLYAPSDGVLLIRILEPGSMVKAGVPVYTISLNDQMWVRAYIQETDLGQVQIGSPVQIETDSTDKVYHGRVGFISSQAEFTPKTIETASLRTDLVYRIRVIIDDADDFLKQGMPVTIRFKES